MVRVTNAVATNRKKRRLLKLAKGFVGDRKNHKRLTAGAVMAAMAFNYKHRKLKKRDFRSLWISRIAVSAKTHGLSYSRLIEGLSKADCQINRKMLSELALSDPIAFGVVAGCAKKALA